MRKVITRPSQLGTVRLVSITALVVAGCAAPAPDEAAMPVDSSAIVFESARLIAGDGSAPTDNATFVVDDGRFVDVGATGDVEVPAGAARVDLGGKTVMPAIIDTHTHLGRTREDLVEDLQRKAFYGVSLALSLGQDTGDLPYDVRAETMPNAARYRTAGRGITRPGWDSTLITAAPRRRRWPRASCAWGASRRRRRRRRARWPS